MEKHFEQQKYGNNKTKRNDILNTLKKQANISPEDRNDIVNFFKMIKKGVSLEDYDLRDLQDLIDKSRKISPPIISVPKKFISNIKQQGYLESHPTWIGHKILCATMGRSPYTPQNEERVFFAVKSHVPISPRFTGKDSLFRGVVTIDKDKLDIHHDLQQLN